MAAVAVQAGSSLIRPSWRARRVAVPAGSPTSSPAAIAGRDGRARGSSSSCSAAGCSSSGVAARRGRLAAGCRPLATAVGDGRAGWRSAWVALKVGALSYGGGFVIVPLMQADAVDRYHWMTDAQFLNAVALGQVTPGPVVHTVAAVGYGAAGLGGGLLAAAVAFAPSFAFVLAGGRRFDGAAHDQRARAFLDGAGPAAIGAILGSAIPLAARARRAVAVRVLGRRGRRCSCSCAAASVADALARRRRRRRRGARRRPASVTASAQAIILR